MENIARALIIACQYIECLNSLDFDDNVKVLEQISHELSLASNNEKLCLEKVASEMNLSKWIDEIGLKLNQ